MLNKNTLETILFDEFTYFYSKNRQLQMISYFKHIYFEEMHIISELNHHTNPTASRFGYHDHVIHPVMFRSEVK